MRKLGITLIILTTTLGIIALALNTLFNTQVVTYLSKVTINEVEMYKLDLYNYAKNLEQTITTTPMIIVNLPSRTWQDITGNILESEFWEALGNNMAYMLDVIIAVANIFLFPLRLAAYLIQIILSLIGLPMTDYQGNPLEWLITFMKTLTVLEIPYV